MSPITDEPGLRTEEIHLGGVLDGQPEPVLTGLGPLKSSRQLMIKQKVQTCEVLTGCEQENRFTITGQEEEVLYWAKEHSGWCERFWCGNVRSFDMTVTDQTTNEVMRLYRPLTCQGCCCSALYPHCTQALTVSVNGVTVGTVRERATWINPVYHVFDSVGNQVRHIVFFSVLSRCIFQLLKIRGPACHINLCGDVEFRVMDVEDVEVGRIAKKWMGCFKETLTDADNFVIDFNDGLCIDTKVLIVAATFLIDMMYFEMNN